MRAVKMLAIVLMIMAAAVPAAYAHYSWELDDAERMHRHREPGTIKIKNETEIKFYVVIDDHNERELDPNSTEDFKARPGEHKIVLEYNDGCNELKRHIRVHPGETSEWTVTDRAVEYRGRTVKW